MITTDGISDSNEDYISNDISEMNQIEIKRLVDLLYNATTKETNKIKRRGLNYASVFVFKHCNKDHFNYLLPNPEFNTKTIHKKYITDDTILEIFNPENSINLNDGNINYLLTICDTLCEQSNYNANYKLKNNNQRSLNRMYNGYNRENPDAFRFTVNSNLQIRRPKGQSPNKRQKTTLSRNGTRDRNASILINHRIKDKLREKITGLFNYISNINNDLETAKEAETTFLRNVNTSDISKLRKKIRSILENDTEFNDIIVGILEGFKKSRILEDPKLVLEDITNTSSTLLSNVGGFFTQQDRVEKFNSSDSKERAKILSEYLTYTINK